MLTIFAGLAQFERECLLERQAEGIAIAKREGRMGRPEIQPCGNFREIVRGCPSYGRYSGHKKGRIERSHVFCLIRILPTRFPS